jgi:hypothetical protein
MQDGTTLIGFPLLGQTQSMHGDDKHQREREKMHIVFFAYN